MTGRNTRGQFTQGNTFAALGWRGLVAKRFDGDTTAARAWLAQLGRHAYAKQAIEGTVFEYRLQTIWRHPGSTGEFLTQWREALNAITLDNVQEVQP